MRCNDFLYQCAESEAGTSSQKKTCITCGQTQGFPQRFPKQLREEVGQERQQLLVNTSSLQCLPLWQFMYTAKTGWGASRGATGWLPSKSPERMGPALRELAVVWHLALSPAGSDLIL